MAGSIPEHRGQRMSFCRLLHGMVAAATEHSCQFLHSIFPFNMLNMCESLTIRNLLDNMVVVMTKACDLGQVSYSNNLSVPS